MTARVLGRKLTWALCAAAITLSSVLAAARSGVRQQAPTFRSRVDEVLVDVAVTDGHGPVAGLVAKDFQLLDNGIKQTVDSVQLDTLPLDVSLVIDASRSTGDAIEQFKTNVRKIAAMLGRSDQIRVIAITNGITLAVPLQPAAAPLALDSIQPTGATALHDALLYALVQPVAANRRQLIVAFTDGLDNFSWLDPSHLPEVAARADAMLDVFVSSRAGMLGRMQRAGQSAQSVSNSLSSGVRIVIPGYDELSGAAHATGGEMSDLGASEDLPSAFGHVIDLFRRSYLLAYVPTGVKKDGWHDLNVKVRNYKVQARKGYVGGP